MELIVIAFIAGAAFGFAAAKFIAARGRHVGELSLEVAGLYSPMTAEEVAESVAKSIARARSRNY